LKAIIIEEYFGYFAASAYFCDACLNGADFVVALRKGLNVPYMGIRRGAQAVFLVSNG